MDYSDINKLINNVSHDYDDDVLRVQYRLNYESNPIVQNVDNFLDRYVQHTGAVEQEKLEESDELDENPIIQIQEEHEESTKFEILGANLDAGEHQIKRHKNVKKILRKDVNKILKGGSEQPKKTADTSNHYKEINVIINKHRSLL